MNQFRKLISFDYRDNLSLLSVPRLGGFLAAPGPKQPSTVHWLLSSFINGVSKDAQIVHWDFILNALVVFEPSQQTITIILRGSASIRDLVVNATVIPWSASPSNGFKDGKVHLGFWNRAESSGLVNKVLAYNPKIINITGHSMGAALGVLVGAKLAAVGSDAKVTIVSFGGPRIGNTAFCESFNHLPTVRHWRVSNGWDPVTRIPPHAPQPIDYRHTGHHLWLSHDISSKEVPYYGLNTTVLQARCDLVGVPRASPELFKPTLSLFQDAIEGGVYGVRGHHQMGGSRGYIAALTHAHWEGTSA